MKFKILLLSLSLILLSISASYSNEDCFPDCEKVSKTPITYSVVQPTCGVCSYKVFYSECIISGKSVFLIDSIQAITSNPTCCQGTAVNDPIVSGFILIEAGRVISLTGVGSSPFSVFTPSRCWKWVGTLGPSGTHNAVFLPCDVDESCCEFTYSVSGGVSTFRGWVHHGPENCDIQEGCLQICD